MTLIEDIHWRKNDAPNPATSPILTKNLDNIFEVLGKFQLGDAAKIEALEKDLAYLVKMGDLDGYESGLLDRLQEAAVIMEGTKATPKTIKYWHNNIVVLEDTLFGSGNRFKVGQDVVIGGFIYIVDATDDTNVWLRRY